MPTPLYRGNRAQHCPPSCANNPLSDLFDRHCSDKGTDFMSKHHYSTAYHAIFGSIRRSVTSLLEIGIGEDQAPSVASWSQYFPFATIYAVDVKSSKRFRARRLRDGEVFRDFEGELRGDQPGTLRGAQVGGDGARERAAVRADASEAGELPSPELV